MFGIHKILVAVDFSYDARAALDAAQLLAAKLDAPVTALHVWQLERPSSRRSSVVLPGLHPMPVEELACIEAQRELDAVLALRTRDGVQVSARLERGVPASEILRVAREDGFDLVVLGAHGRRENEGKALGSVAEAVVRGASCAVLTVRASVQN